MFVTLEATVMSTLLGNFIIVTGSFLVLIFLIRKFVWKQITGIFEAREEKIANDIDTAEQERLKAQELASQREKELRSAKDEAGQIVDNARDTAKIQEAKIIAQAREEASRLKDKAHQDIEQSRTEALSSVKGEVADLTVLLAEKVMTQNLDAKAQSELIDRYLDQLGEA